MNEENKYIIDTEFRKKDVNKDIYLKCCYIIHEKLELSENDIQMLLDYLIDYCSALPYLANKVKAIGGNCVKVIDTQKIISNETEEHLALIVKFTEDKIYLIDPHYKKFFLKENCTKDYTIKKGDYVNYICDAPHPGYYYLTHSEYIPIAKEIIQNGYIKLNPKIAKVYAESFFTTRKGPFINFDNVLHSTINEEEYMYVLTSSEIVNQYKLIKRISEIHF